MCLLTAVYWNHFDNAFHFDDMHTIVNNEFITRIDNIPLIFQDAKTTSSLPTNQAYRPVVTSLNAIDYWIAGKLDSRVFHWHIFLEFLVLLALLYYLINELFSCAGIGKWPVAALLSTAFFAFHTATAETINYIISRSDGFSTLMVIISMIIFIRNTGWKRQLGLIPFLVGCLTKPTALMLAPLLAVYSLIMLKPSLTVREESSGFYNPLKRAVVHSASYFVVGVALYLFTRSMFSDTWTPGGYYSPAEYLVTQAWVIWIYLKTFALPTGLTADTDLTVIRDWLDPKILWGLTIIVFLLATAFWCSLRRKTLPISFGILWFFIALVPSSSIVPLAEVMNHHRTFFPYIGLVIAVGWTGVLLVNDISQRYGNQSSVQRAGVLLALTVLSLHAWGSYQRNEVWHDGSSLWYDVTLKSPSNGRGLMNYGLALMRKGDMNGAIDYFENARKTSYGNHPYLFINLGIAHGFLGRRNDDDALRKKAESYFEAGIRLGPAFPETHYRYANWLYREGRVSEALNHVNRAIRLSPADKNAKSLKSRLLALQSSRAESNDAIVLGEAEKHLDRSLQFYHSGEYKLSIAAARKALEEKPDYAPAYNNICAAYNGLREWELAIEACEKALFINPQFERARGNLDFAKRRKSASF